MIFYFLISIVFIAELIITLTVIISLIKADKKIIEYNSIVDEIKPSLKELMITARKLSEQFLELSPILVLKIKSTFVDILLGQLKSWLGGLTFWLVKKEVEKHV